MAGESATKWRIRPADETAWREVADEVFILDLRTSMHWALNRSAAVLWIASPKGGPWRGWPSGFKSGSV
jgi:hypothetical protein